MTLDIQRTAPKPITNPRFPRGEGYGALIGNQWFRLAPNREVPVRYFSRNSLAPRNDDTGSVYQNTLDIGYAFARGDVSGGEGLDWYPRLIALASQDEIAKDEIRFFDSNNLEVRRPLRGEKARIELSRRVDAWDEGQNFVDMATSDTRLFLAYGDTVEEWSDWDAGAPATTYQASAPIVQIEASQQGDLMALLVTGAIEYAASNSGTFVPVNGDAGEEPPIIAPASVKQMWFAKGRFICEIPDPDDANNNVLQEFDSVGLIGFPFVSYRGDCLSLVSSGPAIVTALSDGTLRTYVPEQSNQLLAGSLNLVQRGVTEVPEGEVPYLLGSNADILLVLTKTTGAAQDNTIRLYQAEVLDARFDYIVGQIQLRREWLNAPLTLDNRDNMANTRDEIWFPVPEDPANLMMWRFDLVTFGISRQYTEPGDPAYSLVAFDRRIGFIKRNEESIYRSSDEYANEGWLITPNITFGLNTDIGWVATVISAQNLVSGGRQVELYYSTNPDAINDKDDPSWILAARISSPGQGDLSTNLVGVVARQVALQLRIYSHTGDTGTPEVTNFAIRGIESQRDWILELPINVSDTIEVPGRRPVRIPEYGHTVFQDVQSLVGQVVEAIVLDPPIGWRGIVDEVLTPTEYISDRGSASVRTILRLRGERITSTANPVGDSGLGLGLLGVSTLGIGQTERT